MLKRQEITCEMRERQQPKRDSEIAQQKELLIEYRFHLVTDFDYLLNHNSPVYVSQTNEN
ncbi:CLUMA_CG021546, isoform A [Clunio marinus]|uniref:CLUMA_CG021546, isoform A n=1 Tax=Clunio marinus TaxID=568069 RepID=A0A1J1J8C2_9DIPT|nr:CLUMA_CG021546, isoform A [Clunio marinus]